MTEGYCIKKYSSVHPWSPEELNMLQQLTTSLSPITRKDIQRYQRGNTLWIMREVTDSTIIGIASLSLIHTLDPSQTFGILHSVKLCKTLDDHPYLKKKLRQMMMESIVDYASKKKLKYIQAECAPGDKKMSDLYPYFGWRRVAQSSNSVHGTHFDRLYLFAEAA